jgi:hypothetical protein
VNSKSRKRSLGPGLQRGYFVPFLDWLASGLSASIRMDINFFRRESGKVDLARESQRRRGLPHGDIDEVIRLDTVWRDGMRRS